MGSYKTISPLMKVITMVILLITLLLIRNYP